MAKKRKKNTEQEQHDDNSIKIDALRNKIQRIVDDLNLPNANIIVNKSRYHQTLLEELFPKVDLLRFVELLNRQLDERGETYLDVAGQLDWPVSLAQLILIGKRHPTKEQFVGLVDYFDIGFTQLPLSAQKPKTFHGENIFISYSHRDKAYLERLLVHLKPLEKQGLVNTWVDTHLRAGDKWRAEIEKGMDKARAAILLISADFLASDFIVDNELPPLLRSAEESGTVVIPVILKPCRFTRDKNLRDFQSINPPSSPLSMIDENERELIYDTVAQRIEDLFANDE